MPEEFVPLDVFLRAASSMPAMAAPPEPAIPAPPTVPADAETLRAARRFRAALADALDASIQRLLSAIAREIVGRELLLRPADIAAIVATALDRHRGERVLSLRAHPADVERLAVLEIPSVADRALEPGDVIVELHSGTIDLRWDARFEAALAACDR